MFDDRKPGVFPRDWRRRLAIVLGATRKHRHADIASQLKGKTRPNKATTGTGTSSYVSMDTRGAGHLGPEYNWDRQGERRPQRYSGSCCQNRRLPSWNCNTKTRMEPVEMGRRPCRSWSPRTTQYMQEVVCATVERLVSSSTKPGQDLDDFFMEKMELAKMGESLFDRRFKNIRVRDFTAASS